MNLPTFKGVGDEDLDQFWFVSDSVWIAQNLASDTPKRAQLSLAFEGRALDWYMRYISQNGIASIQDIKDALKQQFQNPNSYSQIVADVKDFKQGTIESVWEDDQCLKKAIREGEFKYDDRHHTEWFITMLLPHLHIPMGHQTFESQEKALEVAMKLEVVPRDDTQLGVQ